MKPPSEAAPSLTTAAAGVSYTRGMVEWVLGACGRVDNLFDREYAGSVLVNEGNGRYYESAPGRSWSVGVRLGRCF